MVALDNAKNTFLATRWLTLKGHTVIKYNFDGQKTKILITPGMESATEQTETHCKSELYGCHVIWERV